MSQRVTRPPIFLCFCLDDSRWLSHIAVQLPLSPSISTEIRGYVLLSVCAAVVTTTAAGCFSCSAIISLSIYRDRTLTILIKTLSNASAMTSMNVRADTSLSKLRDTPAIHFYIWRPIVCVVVVLVMWRGTQQQQCGARAHAVVWTWKSVHDQGRLVTFRVFIPVHTTTAIFKYVTAGHNFHV